MHARVFRYVWVVEEDVLYGGSLPTFLNLYSNIYADLITLFCPFSDELGTCTDPSGRTSALPHDTREVANRQADANVSVVHHWEHVVRFSPRLIDSLEAALDRGEVIHGENYASSHCVLNHSEWCTTMDLRETLSASQHYGVHKLSFPPLPQDARWVHTEGAHRCAMLTEWSTQRDDAALAVRIRKACTVEEPGGEALMAPPTAAQLARVMRPTHRLMERFSGECARTCCATGLDWCCPARPPPPHANEHAKAPSVCCEEGLAWCCNEGSPKHEVHKAAVIWHAA